MGVGDQGTFGFGSDYGDPRLNMHEKSEGVILSADLRDFEGTNYFYYMGIAGNPFNTGPYTIILENEEVMAAENFAEILANNGQIDSPVNNFNLLSCQIF